MYLHISWGSHKLNSNFFNLRHTLLDMSPKKKVTQVIRFLPLFSMTALFRTGANVVFVLLFNSYNPVSFTYSVFFIVLVYRSVFLAVFLLLFLRLKQVLPEDGGEDGGWRGMAELNQLTPTELGMALGYEFTTITTWGSLSRRDSRRLQMSMNTFIFMTRYWHTLLL